jgi:hypothetical protein
VKKLLLLSVFLVGCNQEFSEMRYVPEGAKFIKSYTAKSSQNKWMKWELDGECFLSYDVAAGNGLLTKVDCPEGAE